MEARRRYPSTATAAAGRRSSPADPSAKVDPKIQASDALPLPIRHTNLLFSFLFMASLFFLMRRWREKIRTSTPLHVVGFVEILSIVSLVSSLIYLLSFFGIAFVQSSVSSSDDEEENQQQNQQQQQQQRYPPPPPPPCPLLVDAADGEKPNGGISTIPVEDEEIIESVVMGKTPSYSLESKLGDCKRAASVRREALKRITSRNLNGLPLDGFDYDSILGQCCEMPIGFVALPVGIAGPLALDGRTYYVPMATTEGCLVASTNRGCKAIGESGGAQSVVLRDGMTRAPAVRFGTAARAAELKFFLEDPANFDTLAVVFNRYVD